MGNRQPAIFCHFIPWYSLIMVKWSEIALLFLRIGSLGFGGPLALVALMEQECVTRKKWVKRERFEESFVFCKMLPGPLAYQMALWVGHELRGVGGGLIAGVCFVLPAATLLFLFAKYYQFIQGLSASSWILDGMRIGAMVIILQSVGSLFSPYRKKVTGWLYALSGALLLTLLPRWEPLIILGGGILSVLLLKKYPDFRLKLQSVSVLLALFWTHFKAGALVFGTGLAIVPILEREVVTKYHWLTQKEFLDALVFGQITPGPVTTLSSFIGYQVAEGFGSLIATFGMYLPGALMILLFLPRIRSSIENKSWLVDFQRGAVPTVIGCLMAASFGLLSGVLVDPVLRATFFVLLLIQIVWVFPAWLVILLGSCLQPILCFVVDSIL